MDGLVKNDNGGAQGRQRNVQTTAGGGRLQLPGEVLQVGVRCVAEELEEIIMETVGVRPVDNHVRDGQNLKEKPCSLTLIGP